MKLPLPLLLAIGSTTLLMAAIPVANHLVARQERPIERQMWAFRDRLQVKFTPENATAQALKQLAEPLKICTLVRYPSPYQSIDASTCEKLDTRADDKLREQIRTYLEEQVQRSNDQIASPPKALQDYLTATRSPRNAIRDLLLSQEVPHWATHPDWPIAPDIGRSSGSPYFGGIVQLQQLLLLDALEQYRLGQTQAALALLEASWQLNRSIRDRPERSAQFTTQAVNRWQLGVIRQLGALPALWQQRLLEHDDRQAELTVLEIESFIEFNDTRNALNSQPYSGVKMTYLQPLGFMGQPIAHQRAVHEFQGKQDYLQALRSLTTCDLPQPSTTNEPAVSWLEHRWQAATHHMLSAELTQQMLQVKTIGAATGKLPSQWPDRPSVICPGSRWVYRVQPDGSAFIALHQLPDWLKADLQQRQTSSQRRKWQLNLADRIPAP